MKLLTWQSIVKVALGAWVFYVVLQSHSEFLKGESFLQNPSATTGVVTKKDAANHAQISNSFKAKDCVWIGSSSDLGRFYERYVGQTLTVYYLHSDPRINDIQKPDSGYYRFGYAFHFAFVRLILTLIIVACLRGVYRYLFERVTTPN